MQPLFVFVKNFLYAQVKPKGIDQTLPPKTLMHLLTACFLISTLTESHDFTLAGSAVCRCTLELDLPSPASLRLLTCSRIPLVLEGSAAPLWLGLGLNHTGSLT